MSSGPSAGMQANVLALNRLYLAIHIVSVRRAFTLLFKGMAEVIHIEDGAWMSYDFEGWRAASELKAALNYAPEDDDWLQAVNFRIRVPRVIRLLNYDRVPRNVVKFNRRNVFLRDEYCCQYCGRQFSGTHLSLDHVIPRSRGGGATWDNIVAACLRCNVRKGGRTPIEAGMSLVRAPSRPTRNPVLLHQVRSQKYEVWGSFLR